MDGVAGSPHRDVSASWIKAAGWSAAILNDLAAPLGMQIVRGALLEVLRCLSGEFGFGADHPGAVAPPLRRRGIRSSPCGIVTLRLWLGTG